MQSINVPEIVFTVGLAVFGAVHAQAVTIVDLGTLGGTSSQAYAINNAGQVVGSSRTTSDIFDHPFLYTHDGMRPLGNITGTAYGINSAGLIVVLNRPMFKVRGWRSTTQSCILFSFETDLAGG